ncbi:MAG: hypothetical protein JJU22_00610 [Gammaproteobacteria bacterium]|nr:hypothetical protein [Gammaproteobacteria bacterium]
MQETSLDYVQNRPRPGGAVEALEGISRVLAEQVATPQLRSLMYLAGQSVARSLPLNHCESLSELEEAVNRILMNRDWGWLRIEDRADDVMFVHGCSPLRSWFGTRHLAWSGGLLEGLYAEWLHQLGADTQLVLRQVGDAEGRDDILRFRFAHAHQF